MRGRDPLVGCLIAGRYRLESQLGSGAVGAVYRARHVLIERPVAIKVLHRDKNDHRAWFLREARAVNRVNHQNIADIYDFGETDEGLTYLVMELLTGDRLVDLLASGPLPVPRALDVVEQAAAALAHAHDLGVVHRDLKPDHIFLEELGGRKGFVKIIDFGLAAVRKEPRLTAKGAVFGTPAYISPEQARGEEAGPASDLYSLGVVLFEMVTGRAPFESQDAEVLLECHRSSSAPDPRHYRPELDSGVAGLIERLLAKSPEDRYGDAYHLLDDCRALHQTAPSSWLESSPPQVTHRPDVPTTPRLDGVAGAALKASILGRMASTVYPGGRGPAQVADVTETMWRLVADLSQVEGELHMLARWDENLRSRSREFVAQLGRKIEEESRTESLLRREIESASRALVILEDNARNAFDEWQRERGRVDELDARGEVEFAQAALQSAGAAAARHEVNLKSVATVEGKIVRWQQGVAQAESQRRRLQGQLERHASQTEGELEVQKPRFAVLGRKHASLLAAVAEAESFLIRHFRRRSECAPLFLELESLGLLRDPREE